MKSFILALLAVVATSSVTEVSEDYNEDLNKALKIATA